LELILNKRLTESYESTLPHLLVPRTYILRNVFPKKYPPKDSFPQDRYTNHPMHFPFLDEVMIRKNLDLNSTLFVKFSESRDNFITNKIGVSNAIHMWKATAFRQNILLGKRVVLAPDTLFEEIIRMHRDF
jgi:hypothetical protein